MSGKVLKRPQRRSAWLCRGTNGHLDERLAVIWDNPATGVRVLSSIHLVPKNTDGSVLVPHFHISATHQAGRPARACTDQEMEVVRRDFDMGGAEEDNHGPGIARHLWLACGEEREPECPCKQDEHRLVEGARLQYGFDGTPPVPTRSDVAPSKGEAS